MAVFASITITEPAAAEAVALANYAEETPVETLYAVAGVLDYYGYPGPLSKEAAEAAIDALLGVVTGLSAHCWQGGDAALSDGIEHWLAKRGRF